MRKTAPKPARKPRGKAGGVPPGGRFWDLRLYVAGQTPKSITALNNLRRICEEHLEGRYRIQVIDLVKNPKLARGDQIVAIPTLVRSVPAPLRRLIGDLSSTERVLVGLDVRPATNREEGRRAQG